MYGVKGWVKVYSFTEPREGIIKYKPWLIKRQGSWQSIDVESAKIHGQLVIAKLAGIDDRDQAALAIGAELSIAREQLPVLSENQYYWSDLIGLDVKNTENVTFGRVDHLFETGANDVLVVKGDKERLIPYIPDVIKAIDLQEQTMLVDWDEEF